VTPPRIRLTLQLCTFNRAHLLARVLDACFEQSFDPAAYEIVLVDDGSTDDTAAVIERARVRASCAFVTIRQANAGLARGRNAGIARARGERIVFIDDDILPVPSFLAEHWRSHERAPRAIVRGAVVNTQSFARLPPPYYTLANYSGNFFWTSNVSVPLATLREAGAFTESFREYGWEDIELGLRLRAAGVRAVFNPRALVFHHKPPPRLCGVPGMLAQARAQARTAAGLERLHPRSWRVALAIGSDPVRLALRRLRGAGGAARYEPPEGADRALTPGELRRARAAARDAYGRELLRARRASGAASAPPDP